MPYMLNWFGWCTWDAFYTNLTIGDRILIRYPSPSPRWRGATNASSQPSPSSGFFHPYAATHKSRLPTWPRPSSSSGFFYAPVPVLFTLLFGPANHSNELK
ncbi:hypothetical protein SEVIR_9G574500v4 [Setaria viridis]|uniref:Uncharacterized protein n=1 Tax=Setaria viridis TaxID=4556 RepID=A0A4V6D2H6_SETVI|nr:hypothetical protein SEVIR_9G574500v2 [Setaria viridis]TKV98663.1 hypothetical protein SEVIR_9G574500v2 [Setaria viridis]TKV98664.1 hypothetical protein SEVIR_9G574500v2 [Setaria viridis]TKV98665.1 hypothetical protein SEVIR_9G574500v2 [Setaria viridis]